MTISVFDLFSIGIGPSSSHTVGPMKAAKLFVKNLESEQLLNQCHQLQVILYGSLGFTGKAHGSEKAIYMGLCGEDPETVDPKLIPEKVKEIEANQRISLLGKKDITFKPEQALIFNRTESLPLHSNGMEFEAYDSNNNLLLKKTYYSIGGGFLHLAENKPEQSNSILNFQTGKELLDLCQQNKISISEVMLRRELEKQTLEEIQNKLLNLWQTMQVCIHNGCTNEGILPGGLKVKRRAPELFQNLSKTSNNDPLKILDWVSLYAIAVNEENAAGGTVVTAPTNGAAGIIPAVLSYYVNFCNGTNEGVVKFLLTSAAIGILFKINASISGAEVGCQGEVGVACSMAAAGLTEVMGGSAQQAENAAEIGMEHNLGLTCDPIGGLVQVPCIERNAMGAVKAINASRLALQGDGSHFVSLDKVIKTMKATGADMKETYKETSRGGLAVNVVEC